MYIRNSPFILYLTALGRTLEYKRVPGVKLLHETELRNAPCCAHTLRIACVKLFSSRSGKGPHDFKTYRLGFPFGLHKPESCML